MTTSQRVPTLHLSPRDRTLKKRRDAGGCSNFFPMNFKSLGRPLPSIYIIETPWITTAPSLNTMGSPVQKPSTVGKIQRHPLFEQLLNLAFCSVLSRIPADRFLVWPFY
ncbi:uncharacterized protein LOC142238930 [Haematobia irritans]|uniref:uncharacterized protein LOC142238930 n=1 Tax=Haematobia irritans TaxID=7368 RepID=UPI003F4F7616